MSNRIEVCKEDGCQKPFSVTEFGGAFGIRDLEAIKCPHCDAVWGYEKSSGVFATTAVVLEPKA